MAADIKRFPSLSHWGAFTAVVADGRLQACEPFALDQAPSPILQSMPGMVHSPCASPAPPCAKAGCATASGPIAARAAATGSWKWNGTWP